MFENLLAQDELLSALKADILSDTLPPTLLFTGPAASGKCTAALELARTQSCTGPGPDEGGPAPWNCSCPSCLRHRALTHPDLLMLGRRFFPEEIPAALELLSRAPGRAASFFFLRAVRKLGKRFDAALYEGEESRLAKAAPLLREIEELVEAFSSDTVHEEAKTADLVAAAKKATAAAAKLEALAPDAPPVFMIRNVELWARLSPMGRRKLVIIENAETMQESARNALLKILEEPPDSVRFVLTSTRRQSMMQTILSRSRGYHFRERPPHESARVIERVFRSAEPAMSVAAFLEARRAFPPSLAREHARALVSAALARAFSAAPAKTLADSSPPLARIAQSSKTLGHSAASTLASLFEASGDFGQKDPSFSSSFPAFLSALADCLSELVRDPEIGAEGIHFVQGCARLVRLCRDDYETFNRSPTLLAESLVYAMGEIQ